MPGAASMTFLPLRRLAGRRLSVGRLTGPASRSRNKQLEKPPKSRRAAGRAHHDVMKGCRLTWPFVRTNMTMGHHDSTHPPIPVAGSRLGRSPVGAHSRVTWTLSVPARAHHQDRGSDGARRANRRDSTAVGGTYRPRPWIDLRY